MNAMRRAAISILALPLLLTGCGDSKPSPQQAREHCLYAAVRTYPGWNAKGTVLDSIPECKALSVDEREALRTMTDQFVDAANAKSKEN